MNTVFIKDLKLNLFIGIYPQEKISQQQLLISLELQVKDFHKASTYDKIDYAVDYENLCTLIAKQLTGKKINLIETVAEKICKICFTNPLIINAKIRVDKPTALEQAKSVAVEITRQSPFYIN